MKVNEILQQHIRQALSTGLAGVQGITAQHIDGIVSNITNSASAVIQPEIDKALTLAKELEANKKTIADFETQAKVSKENSLFKEAGVSEKQIAAYKAYMKAEDLEAVQDAAGLKKLLTAAAKASDGLLKFDAVGVNKPAQKSSSPFDVEEKGQVEQEGTTDFPQGRLGS